MIIHRFVLQCLLNANNKSSIKHSWCTPYKVDTLRFQIDANGMYLCK